MRIISGISEFQLNKPTAVAIGKFDGIHLGHKALIEEIIDKSKKDFLQSVIFTFNPSPESFFCKRALKELSTVSEKRHMFEMLGIDVLIEFPLNDITVATDPELFIEKYLYEQMRAKYIVAGTDISFGKKGLGNSALLQEKSDEYGYEVKIIDKISYAGDSISSTRVRDAICAGDMELANNMLGAPYKVTGIVSHGRHLGTQMGMPTANVIIPPDKLVGPNGVYISRVITANGIYNSISNIGVKPTVSDDELQCVESYIYDFNEDIYGKYIEVELIKFCRPEMKFGSVEELKRQMQQDIAAGHEYHEKKTV